MLRPFAAAMAACILGVAALSAGEPSLVAAPEAPEIPGVPGNPENPAPPETPDAAVTAPTAPAPGAEADDPTAATLRQLLGRPGLEPAASAAIRDALERLRRQEARQTLAGESGRLADELRRELERAREAQPHNRARGLLLVRYLMFLDDFPAARALMEKLRPASAADVAWPLTMADIDLQLGDDRRAFAYASQAASLLQAGGGFSLAAPVAVTEVSGYRLYVRDGRAAFAPGADLLLYVEIEGARFQVRGNEWQCQLDFGLELLDAEEGVRDKNLEYGRYDQGYAGRVREMHASVNYRVPADLKAGRYTLRLFCRDRVADAAAHVDFAFNVSGVAERRADLQQERKVDADLYKRALEGVDPLAPVPGMDPLDILEGLDGKKPGADAAEDLKKKYRLQGLNISRERSKMQGGLFTQP